MKINTMMTRCYARNESNLSQLKFQRFCQIWKSLLQQLIILSIFVVIKKLASPLLFRKTCRSVVGKLVSLRFP